MKSIVQIVAESRTCFMLLVFCRRFSLLCLIHFLPVHHTHPPLHTHHFIPGSKLTFSTNLSHHSLLAPTWTAFSDYNWTGLSLLNDFSFLVIFLSFYCATLCVSAVFVVVRCPSVRQSVRHAGALYLEDIVKLLSQPGSPILVLWLRASVSNSKGNPFSISRSAKYTGWKILRISSQIVVYFGNGTKYANGCYGTLIGNHRWRIDPCRFRWPWVTLTRVSKSLYTYKTNILKIS